jgi:trehalose-phosphatase
LTADSSGRGWTRVGAWRGIADLDRILGRQGRLLIVSDFDGTLAEGSRDPAEATIVPLARRALRRLARVERSRPDRLAVAILTGRAVRDVATRVRVGGIRYLGDHGLQAGTYPRGRAAERVEATIVAGHEASIEPAAILADRVPRLLGSPAWLFVERKGPSVAFHVRQADDRVAARAAVETAIETIDRDLPPHDLAHYRGRLVVDLRPRSAGGKREALEGLIETLRPAAAIALGDDLSDVDAFAVLRAARDAGQLDALVVGVTGPHGMPDEVRETADVVLDTPFEAARLLARMARALEVEVEG